MDFTDEYSSGESAQSETKEMYLGEGGRTFSLADHGYTVMDRIGEGAYGVVYSAKDNRSGRLVAIKKIEGALDRVSACKRTYRELKLLSLLKHENLIPLRHILSNDVSPNETKNSTEPKSTEIYAVFDLMETDLTTIIKSPQHLTSEHCQFFLYQVLRGLLFMHTAGVIHRDLKPRNVLVNSNCDLRICDFGLARLQVDGPSDARHMTDYVATRWYRAPEIIVGAGTYDKAIDMFSVGCILAELLLRKPIFPGADQYDMLKRLCEVLGPPPDHMIRNAKSAKMHSYLKSLAYQYPKALYPLRNIFRGCSSKALDLMSRLLTWDPAQRLTVQEALRHPYLAKLYCPEDEPVSKPLGAHEFAFEHDRSLVVPDFKRMVQVQINAYAAANKVAPTQIEIVDKRPHPGAPAPAPVLMANKLKNQTVIPGARAGDASLFGAVTDDHHQQQQQQQQVAEEEEKKKGTASMLRGSGKHMYDLVVVGGGSGGVRASRIAAGHGAKVALVEASVNHGPPTYSAIGGTCVNVGCVPKKLMVYGSSYREEFEHAAAFGWSKGSATHDWATFMEKKDKEISRLNGIYGRMLGGAGVEIVEGWGKLKGTNEVVVSKPDGEEVSLTAETILIAVGGWPFKPDIPGIEHAITSNEVFYLKELPQRTVVVGGGYIAVEFAAILHGFGSEVTLMYRRDLFLRGFDKDLREHLKTEMERTSMNLQFNTNVAKIEKNGDGSFTVTTDSGDTVECDCVLYATGRKSKTEGLGLESAGVETDKAGNIPVDEYSRSNVDNIYAVGDVTDRINLTPVALHEGHCFADTMYGKKDRKPDHEYVASAVFSHPEIGTVGYSEEDAADKFKNITVYKSTFRPMVHTITGLESKALMKLIVDDNTDRVVGAHMCGPHAAEILQGVGIAVKMGATKADFDATIGIHPTSAEEFVTMRTPSHKYKDGVKQSNL